jgi:hypothetical protein
MKLLSKRSVALTSILLLGIAYFYQSGVDQRELELKVQRLEVKAKKYEEKFKSCVPTSIIYQAGYSSDPRTSKRLTEVASIFNQIADASCFSSLQGSMLSNPYKEIRLGELGRREHSPLEEEVYQGFLYEYDKGAPFLRSGWTLCEDGSLSGSAGRGTCSWHGGYAKQRGETFNFDFAEKIPNPRDKIAQLLDQ